MGKVFTWDEIAARRFPQLESFYLVADNLRQQIESTDAIVGAMLCGSSVLRRWTLRSDIDCVVVYDSADRKHVERVCAEIHLMAAGFQIPVELSIARTPLHSIGRSFASHLRYAAAHGGVIKTNPLDLLYFEDGTGKEDVRSYVRNKLRKLEKDWLGFLMGGPQMYARFLQKVVELPVHLGRKMLWVQGVELEDDSKQTVLRRYPEIASTRERELFHALITADDNYTQELLSQLRRPDERRYTKAIASIAKAAWNAIEFTQLNALRLI